MLGILVPEVECTVGARGGESAVNWVEGYGVHGVDFCDIPLAGVLLAVAFEREIGAGVRLAFLKITIYCLL